MNITYKMLTREAIPELTLIMKEAFDADTRMHTQLLEDGPNGYDTGELLEKLLDMDNCVSQIILCEDKLIGEYTIKSDNGLYTLEMLFIDPEFESRGIGLSVWKDIESEYKQAKTWMVETPGYSIRNHRFYEKCGFKVIKEFKYPEGETSLIFIKHMKKSSILIRRYNENDDYNKILESCIKERWIKFYTNKKDEYKQALRKSITYVAYDETNYCGYMRCITDEVFTTYCCEIIVDDLYKRSGIGHMLIDTVKETYPLCSIDVLSDNDEFYKSNEFISLCTGMRKIPE